MSVQEMPVGISNYCYTGWYWVSACLMGWLWVQYVNVLWYKVVQGDLATIGCTCRVTLRLSNFYLQSSINIKRYSYLKDIDIWESYEGLSEYELKYSDMLVRQILDILRLYKGFWSVPHFREFALDGMILVQSV